MLNKNIFSSCQRNSYIFSAHFSAPLLQKFSTSEDPKFSTFNTFLTKIQHIFQHIPYINSTLQSSAQFLHDFSTSKKRFFQHLLGPLNVHVVIVKINHCFGKFGHFNDDSACIPCFVLWSRTGFQDPNARVCNGETIKVPKIY